MPRGRATRRKDTCTVECYDKLKQWRKHLQGQRKCNTCLAPYTDKQRAEFRLWRQETGGLRVKRGKPPIAKEQKLVWALKRVIANVDIDSIAADIAIAALTEVGEIPKPVDTAPPESNSISADHATI